MSMHQQHCPVLDGETLEVSHEPIVAGAVPFPPYEDMVIDELTDDEEARFLAAISGE